MQGLAPKGREEGSGRLTHGLAWSTLGLCSHPRAQFWVMNEPTDTSG